MTRQVIVYTAEGKEIPCFPFSDATEAENVSSFLIDFTFLTSRSINANFWDCLIEKIFETIWAGEKEKGVESLVLFTISDAKTVR